jgi:phosphoribosylformylglycinamidine cyclo-ligase
LVRKIIERSGVDLHAAANAQLAQDLIAPTRIYVKPLLTLMQALPVKAMAHITGGGLTENIPRMFPRHLKAVIERNSWTAPSVFAWLQQHGKVSDVEMARTFNCGIGMVVVVAKERADEAATLLRAAGETVFAIGNIRERVGDEHQTIVS